MAKSERKADRWLIIGGVLVLLVALGFLTFDDWIWGGHRSGGDVIGVIASRTGDVRLKYDGDVKWQKAAKGENLVYNDTVFAGANSEANLKLGNSDLQVQENTLVVLRRQDDARFLNLNYGKLLGKIAKDDKIIIDTGDGRSAVLSATVGSEIVLEKKNGQTEVKVVKGEAELTTMGGQKQKLNPSVKPVIADTPPPAATAPPPPAPPPPPTPPLKEVKKVVTIRAIKPKANDVLYSKEPITANFEWAVDGKPIVDPKDRFTIEFSKSQTFDQLFASKTVDGKVKEDVSAKNSLDVFYRIRGPQNELSQTEKFTYVHMVPPKIVAPVKDATYSATTVKPAHVKVAYNEVPGQPQYWMQIASDAEFKTVLINDSKPDLTNVQELPAGSYYVRARSDYGSEHLSDWSESVPFQVKERTPAPRPVKALAVAPKPTPPPVAFDNNAVIQNKAYPERLYAAPKQEVQKYLAENEGFLQGYFSALKGQADEVVLDGMDGAKPGPTSYNWPAKKIYPGQQAYRYQVLKRGRMPSHWSAKENLKITLEPPRQTSVQADIKKPNAKGAIPMTVKFTPLLFADKYEVQLAHSIDFKDAKSLDVKKPQVGFYAKEKDTYYWRARALDEKGQALSEFSEPSSLNAGKAIMQARRESNKERQPAATNTVSMSQDAARRTFDNQHGKWMWVGSGMNFTSYTQSILGRGTFDSHDIEPAGAYLEFGFADNTWGGVFSYKSTPGTLQLSNATVNNPSFNWQTFTGEALYCPIAPRTLFGDPLMVGLRAGMQYQSMPFATVNATGTALDVNTITMLNASVGALAEWSREKWRYYWTMRYQYPLSAGSSTTTITPTFAFDGSVGTAYYFADHWKAGLFWYGQWQQFQFASNVGATTNTGSQMLFYSAMDLRLGYDF